MTTGTILLIGGGHAHVAVLADWIERGLPCESAVMLTPYPTLRYSGMVPGWIGGQYDRDAGLVDLAGLARRAGVDLVLDECVGIDPEGRTAMRGSGKPIAFDIASIDTGGVGRAHEILGDDPRLLDVRPIDAFVERLQKGTRIAVVGGGAGGVELAFALRNRNGGAAQVSLITGEAGLLPGFSGAVRRKAAAELTRQGIQLIEADARLKSGTLYAGGVALEPVDQIVAALGSGAPQWPQISGLTCDQDGFIAVDAYQRSVSHPNILAAGDIAARQDRDVPHSGVHAVHAGPVLAENLRAIAEGHTPDQSYTPRQHSLYLISTGNGQAIASYGPIALQGRAMGKLKHWIDTRWIRTYARLSGSL